MLSTIGSIASQNQLPVWDKYNTVITHHYTWDGQINYLGYYSYASAPLHSGGTNYSFSEATGFSINYSTTSLDDFYLTSYNNTRLTNWVTTGGSGDAYYKRWDGNAVDNPTSSKGTLVQADIRAVAGTYPNDGVHTDGYWYTKRI